MQGLLNNKRLKIRRCVFLLSFSCLLFSPKKGNQSQATLFLLLGPWPPSCFNSTTDFNDSLPSCRGPSACDLLTVFQPTLWMDGGVGGDVRRGLVTAMNVTNEDLMCFIAFQFQLYFPSCVLLRLQILMNHRHYFSKSC